MAITKYTKKGYGQIEMNQVAWRRDGRIEAQCELDDTDFSDDKPAENGTVLVIDRVNRKLYLPTATNIVNGTYGINYSTEWQYDEREWGLQHYATKPKWFLPRLGYFAKLDKFTINAMCYDDGEFTDDTAFDTALADIKTTPLYAGVCTDPAAQSYWEISATKPTNGPVALVVEDTTMPDGQKAVMLQIIED